MNSIATIRFTVTLLCVLPGVLWAQHPAPEAAKQTIRCAVIGGLMDAGLWPEVAKRFEAKTGHTVEVAVWGNKDYLIPAFLDGDADLLTMHVGDPIINLVADGVAENPQPWVRNDMVIVGPPSDPAKIRGEKSAVIALSKIISTRSKVLLHGSQGAGEVLQEILAAGEMELDAGQIIAAPTERHRQMLARASEEKAYAIVGRIPFLNSKIERQDMQIMVQGDKRLPRAFLVVTATGKADSPRLAAARELAAFLRSEETQTFLQEFGKGKLDEGPLFFPVVVKGK